MLLPSSRPALLASTSLFLAVVVSAAPSSAAAARTTPLVALVPSPLPTPASLVTSRARTSLLLLLPALSPLPTLVTARSKRRLWFDIFSNLEVLCLVVFIYSMHGSMGDWCFVDHRVFNSSCCVEIFRVEEIYCRTISPLSGTWPTDFLLHQYRLIYLKRCSRDGFCSLEQDYLSR